MTGWSGSPALDRNVYQFVDTSGARNYAGYSNRRVDTLLDEERRADAVKAQRALYSAAFKIVRSDRPFVFLYHAIAYAAVASGVQGAQLFSDIQLRLAFARYR